MSRWSGKRWTERSDERRRMEGEPGGERVEEELGEEEESWKGGAGGVREEAIICWQLYRIHTELQLYTFNM